jgi:hypothetical protein
MTSSFPPFYLFLDVDGVLHDRRVSAVENFEFADRLGVVLARYPEVLVVVSSSMGRIGTLANLQSACGPLLGPRLHDFTPIVKRVIDGAPPFHRFVEIAYWLATHPSSRPDSRDPRLDALPRHDWTALDVAAHWFPPECAQLIRVDSNLGLADEYLDELESRLNAQRRRKSRSMPQGSGS